MGDRPRRMLAVSYRPEWAGPMMAGSTDSDGRGGPVVPVWDEADVEQLPPAVCGYD